MSATPHELIDEFPDAAAAIQALRATDARFVRLADDYRAVNGAIHRGETNLEPMGDLHLEDLKKRRLAMLDAVAARLAEA